MFFLICFLYHLQLTIWVHFNISWRFVNFFTISKITLNLQKSPFQKCAYFISFDKKNSINFFVLISYFEFYCNLSGEKCFECFSDQFPVCTYHLELNALVNFIITLFLCQIICLI